MNPNTLDEANKRMWAVFEEYEVLAKKLVELEFAYQSKYNKLFLSSKMATNPQKEAETIGLLTEEGLYLPLLDMRADVRILGYKVTAAQEYCKNLRALLQVKA